MIALLRICNESKYRSSFQFQSPRLKKFWLINGIIGLITCAYIEKKRNLNVKISGWMTLLTHSNVLIKVILQHLAFWACLSFRTRSLHGVPSFMQLVSLPVYTCMSLKISYLTKSFCKFDKFVEKADEASLYKNSYQKTTSNIQSTRQPDRII